MIIIANYIERFHDDLTIIYSREDTYCPACGEDLIPHGRCQRKLILPEGAKVFSLRVSYCEKCRHSHRELPDFMIPYKRHCTETYAKVFDTPHGALDCDVDEKTERSIRTWVARFIAFITVFCNTVKNCGTNLLPDSNAPTLTRLKCYIRLIVNKNQWLFSVPPFSSG